VGYKTQYAVIEKYLLHLRVRSELAESVKQALVYGSVSRHSSDDRSDVDVRIIAEAGRWNAVKAALFVLTERIYAFARGIPLDIYMFEDLRDLQRMSKEESPIVLVRK
jgi:predicted nucleotidyltransferase